MKLDHVKLMNYKVNTVLTYAFSTVNAKEKDFAHLLDGAEEKISVETINQNNVVLLKKKDQFVKLMMIV